MFVEPFIIAAALLAVSTVIGLAGVRKLIEVYEANHELKRGSAGFLRTMSGWGLVLLWLMAVWFCATILGDWHATGDLDGAIERSWLRLRILLEIAAAFGDN
ncbi:hypothetical protein [Pseudaestuariivita sp.]|uniref:hypothetical protein n=1 Tax=Pseudaestuariivita sp. TaxID=2211669 RepID=UPI0040588CB9